MRDRGLLSLGNLSEELFITRTFCVMKSTGTLQKEYFLFFNKMFIKVEKYQTSSRNVTTWSRERDLLK